VNASSSSTSEGKVQNCYTRKGTSLVELGDVRRDSGFEFVHQARRELFDRTIPTEEILSEIEKFQFAWQSGEIPLELAVRYSFKKVHNAECERRGILLYEIYAKRGKYRAVVAWISLDGPGYWVAVFKKQGDAQSRSSLHTAAERAINRWREMND
jgi:hypothetical protein